MCDTQKKKDNHSKINNLSNIIESIRNIFIKIDYSKIANNFIVPLIEIAEALEKAEKNPNSVYNFYNYMKKLSKYYWSMPYKLEGDNLKIIFEKVNSEEEFDSYMLEYFSNDILKMLFADIESKLSQNHKELFSQIIFAFDNNLYALINSALLAIIDDELSFYLEDKENTKRTNIFEPILEDLKAQLKEVNPFNIIYLEMLANNINIIFENISFNNVSIKTNKKARRHTTQHGVLCSNQRQDSIMLVNTLYNILYTKEYLTLYESKITLTYNKKTKKYELKN